MRIGPTYELTSQISVYGVCAQSYSPTRHGRLRVQTFSRGYWPVAGVDLMLLATALLAGWSAGGLRARTNANELACEIAAKTAHG